MRAFCDDDVNKPFGVRYKHYSNTIEVDRSIVRGPAPEGDECKDSFIIPHHDLKSHTPSPAKIT